MGPGGWMKTAVRAFEHRNRESVDRMDGLWPDLAAELDAELAAGRDTA